MTRKEALAELIANVEAGSSPPLFGRADPCGLGLARQYVRPTFNGSLDAAKALHEAVLPEYGYGVTGTMSDGNCRACVVPMIDNPTEYHGISDNPARAWLLSILRALHAMEAAE